MTHTVSRRPMVNTMSLPRRTAPTVRSISRPPMAGPTTALIVRSISRPPTVSTTTAPTVRLTSRPLTVSISRRWTGLIQPIQNSISSRQPASSSTSRPPEISSPETSLMAAPIQTEEIFRTRASKGRSSLTNGETSYSMAFRRSTVDPDSTAVLVLPTRPSEAPVSSPTANSMVSLIQAISHRTCF